MVRRRARAAQGGVAAAGRVPLLLLVHRPVRRLRPAAPVQQRAEVRRLAELGAVACR